LCYIQVTLYVVVDVFKPFVVLDVVDNEIEVTCMEACDKAEGRYKWTMPEVKIWIAKSNSLE